MEVQVLFIAFWILLEFYSYEHLYDLVVLWGKITCPFSTSFIVISCYIMALFVVTIFFEVPFVDMYTGFALFYYLYICVCL